MKTRLVGIDEVGRGCWAGPLVAAAVIIDKPIPGLNDSKVLSAKRRKQLDGVIREQAVAFGLGWVWPAHIDEVGLTEAVRLAMAQALAAIDTDYDEVIIDGNYNYLESVPNTRWIIKADATVPAVSAASIIAKVARDEYMQCLAEQIPSYGFESHKGYGTAQHREAIARLGPTLHHRLSYKPLVQCALDKTK